MFISLFVYALEFRLLYPYLLFYDNYYIIILGIPYTIIKWK